MAKSSEYRMAIKIAGEIEKSLYNSTDLTRKELNKIARQAAYTSTATKDSFSKGLKEAEPFFNDLEKAGVKAFEVLTAAAVASGTAIIGIGTMAAQAGIGFESAFAGVKKTTNATAEEYAQLRGEILAMTREIPASGEEIAAVAEAAGQLGIEKENLLSFSRTMIDLGESTNLTSEEAASSLAKFANITNMAADDYGRLGSVIVDLGNNFATTEADIVSMATNMASAGELAGFTEPQIMAMAAAMSSVGIEAEAGGSSMSKMIKKVQVAVETESKSLKDYAKVADMSVEEFKDAFQKDGLTAIASFIAGLNDVERNGKSATVILDEMGLTEVRLSNTLLSLANADELMLEAVTTANDAWDENVALANEAAQRYETTESKIAIMKNGFTEMGIAMYDQFNEPLSEGIDIVTDLIYKVTEDIIKGVPTATRIIKQTADAVGDFAEPFLEVGGWLVDHPGVIAGTITGIGTSLMTYKVATGVMSLVESLSALGPAGMAVLGIGGVAAVITGIGTSIKKSAAEAKKANLEKHFGNISLSMKELHETASFIVKSKSLEQIQESISAMGELDGISNQIDSTVEDLNRMNWKVSMGMELTDQESQNYQSQIESFVQSTQEYITQRQYSVNLSVSTLLGDDLESSNLVTQLNNFYADKQQELADIGTKLNQAVTDAFQDGLLDIDEVEEIAELQRQMAHMQAALADSDFEASLDLIGMKYSGASLDTDSFENLQAEVQDQTAEAMYAYDEVYKTAMSENRLLLSEGRITQDEFNLEADNLNNGYLQQKMDLQAKALQFQMDTIKQAYGDDIDKIYSETERQLEEKLNQAVGAADTTSLAGLGADIMYETRADIDDKATIDALKDLYEQMLPAKEQMEELEQQYRDAGLKVPEAVEKGLSDINAIAAITGDEAAMWEIIGKTVESGEYNDAITQIVDAGKYIPEQIGDAIVEKQDEIKEAVFTLWDATQLFINEAYGNELKIPLKIQTGFPYSDEYITRENTYKNINIANNADGGIVTSPTLSWVAEGGYPESIIPLDGSQNAVELWQRTGEMLGVFNRKDGYHALAAQLTGESSETGGNTVNNSEESSIVINPVFHINTGSGKDNADEIEKAIRDVLPKFEEIVRSVIKEDARNRERFSFR